MVVEEEGSNHPRGVACQKEVDRKIFFVKRRFRMREVQSLEVDGGFYVRTIRQTSSEAFGSAKMFVNHLATEFFARGGFMWM